MITPRPDETYEEWAIRVSAYERARARNKINSGKDPVSVLEEMSVRITNKLLHPLVKAVRESYVSDYDSEKSKAEYERIMRYHLPIADHIVDEKFDKTD